MSRTPSKLADGRRIVRWALDDTDASELRSSGFVPIAAADVRPGDRIASRATWFGFGVGDVQTSTVTAVTVTDYGSAVIETSTTIAEEDEGLPVWVVPS